MDMHPLEVPFPNTVAPDYPIYVLKETSSNQTLVGGIGTQSPKGYGISYSLRPKGISFSISWFDTKSATRNQSNLHVKNGIKFRDALTKSFKDLMILFPVR